MILYRASARTKAPYLGLGLIIISSMAAAPKATTSPASPTTSTQRHEYVSFKSIADHNIFDSNRSSRSARGGGEDRKPNKVDTLTLVGAMSYEKGFYAFFDGSSSEYKQVLEPGKSIAGFKIASVSGHAVKLETSTNTVELTVGMQMRREEEGPWQVVAGSGPQASSSSTSDSSTESAPGDESDIVKKLMQQREQELK